MRRDQGIIRDGYNAARPMGSGLAGRKVRPMGPGKSDYITTRCYSPDGVQIWDGDFGRVAYAIAVGPNGWVYHSGDSATASAMRPGGRIMWESEAVILGDFSYGITATQNGYVYYGLNNITTPANRYISKLDAASGEEVLQIGTVATGRVRSDGSNNVYADWAGADTIVKYVSDVEFWKAAPVGLTGFGLSGMDVTTAGDVFSSDSDLLYSGTMIAQYRFDTTVGIMPPTPPVILSFTNETSPVSGGATGYKNIGCSPDGTQWVAYNIQTRGITGTKSVLLTGALGGSIFRPYTAMAINDSGVYVYSIERSVGDPPQGTHEIRAADNSLIARLDHGGAIYDAIVLPNGQVIVAGDRVLRADFPDSVIP